MSRRERDRYRSRYGGRDRCRGRDIYVGRQTQTDTEREADLVCMRIQTNADRYRDIARDKYRDRGIH